MSGSAPQMQPTDSVADHGFLLLAHGSAHSRSAEAVAGAAAALTAQVQAPVRAAFLDHNLPDLAGAATQLTAEGVTDLTVLPLLLAAGFHARIDVPAALTSAEAVVADQADRPVRFRLLPPLGHPSAVLDAVVRAGEATDVVLVAAGTAVASERTVFAQSAKSCSQRTGKVVTVAFATGPGPTVAEAVAGLTNPVIAPWLVAPGYFATRIRRLAHEVDCKFLELPQGLIGLASMQQVIAERLSA